MGIQQATGNHVQVPRLPCCCTSLCRVRPLLAIVAIAITLLLIRQGTVTVAHFFRHSPSNSSENESDRTANMFTVGKQTQDPDYDFQSSVFHLRDKIFKWYRKSTNGSCYVFGSIANEESCICLPGWFGADCGIPITLWDIPWLRLQRRQGHPRRVIHAFLVGNSLDMIEIRLHELKNTVDVFVIAEQNHTGNGIVFPNLINKQLKDFSKHVLYAKFFNGSQLLLTFLGTQLLYRLSDVRPDDIVVFSTSEAMPSAEVLACIKLYDGFPDFFALYYRPVVQGFYRRQDQHIKETPPAMYPSAISVQYLLRNCSGDAACLVRKGETAYVLGSPEYPCGWNCSQCSPSTKVQFVKSESDAPVPALDPMLAPNYVLQHAHRFQYLIQAPLDNATTVNRKNSSLVVNNMNVTKDKGNLENTFPVYSQKSDKI